MRKFLFVFLAMVLSASCATLISCKRDEAPKEPNNNSEAEIVLPEEITVPVGDRFVPNIKPTNEGETIEVKVVDPTGKNVFLGADYSFTVVKYGTYTMTVKLNEKDVAICQINAVDGTAPEIITAIADKTDVELGVYKKLDKDLETLVAKDDKDGTTVNYVLTKYRFADGMRQDIKNKSILFDRVGTYTIYGYVSDSSDNRKDFSYKISTTDTVKPVVECDNIYYLWAVNGKVSIPKVNVVDKGIVTVEANIKNADGQSIEVKDGQFEAVPGKYIAEFTAIDEGKNVSNKSVTSIRVLDEGVVADFNDKVDEDLLEGGLIENGAMKISGAMRSDTVLKNAIKDWSKFGYLTLKVKNNLNLKANMTILLNGKVYGDEEIAANYDGKIDVLYKDMSVLASNIENIELKFSGKHDVTINDITLSKLPEDIFELETYKVTVKSFEEIVIPEIKYIESYGDFVRNSYVEVIGTTEYTNNKNTYVFKNTGSYVIKYIVETLTNETFVKNLQIVVTTGDPILIIDNLPLGVINKEAFIARFKVFNLDESDITSVEATYKEPGSDKLNAIEGDLNGFKFTPTKKGVYDITITVKTAELTLTETKSMYVKLPSETISYESNNGNIEGDTPHNDWLGAGKWTFNTDPKYVYSGLMSAKYEIPAWSNSGSTYFLENMLKVDDVNSDVIQFMITAETNAKLIVYIHVDSITGTKHSGYSKEITIKAGEWTTFTAPISSFIYNEQPINIPEGNLAGITGLEFDNRGAATTFYIDQISTFSHKDLEMVKVGKDVETKTFEAMDVPHGQKLFPDYTYQSYEEKMYRVGDNKVVDLTDRKTFYFAESGDYVFEIKYKVFDEEFSVKQNYKVAVSTEAALMIEDLRPDPLVNQTSILPSVSYNTPEGTTGVLTITAESNGQETIFVDTETREFVPTASGKWIIKYTLTYGAGKIKELSFETYVRSNEDLFTFENSVDGVKGLDEGDSNLGVSLNTDLKYVTNGSQSMKISYNASAYTVTEKFGSGNGFFLNYGIIRNGYHKMGYTENKLVGANAVTLDIYATKDCQVVLDIPGVANKDDYAFSTIYELKEGWNTIQLDNKHKLENKYGDFNYSEGIYKLFIGSYVDGAMAPTENFDLYVDNVKLIFAESAFELKPGEAITFEKIDGYHQGEDIVGARTSDAGVEAKTEITSEWASQGNYSLKITFNNANFTTNAWREATKGYGAVDITGWKNGFGLVEAGNGMNAMQVTMKAEAEMNIVFEVYYYTSEAHDSNVYDWAYTRPYHFDKGQTRTIIIGRNDLSSMSGAGNPIMFNYGWIGCNIFNIDSGNVDRTAHDVLYVDGFTFINIPEYVRADGEIMSFESHPEGVVDLNNVSNVKACDSYLTDEWATSGKNSLKVVFNQKEFTDLTVGSSTIKQGYVSFGDYGRHIFPAGAINEVNGNAIAVDIYAERDCDIMFYLYYQGKDGQPSAKGYGEYSKIYHLKAGDNQIVIGQEDGIDGKKFDFSEGIGQLLVYGIGDDSGKDLTILVDNIRYYRIKKIKARTSVITFEDLNGSTDGFDKISDTQSLTYEVSRDWASSGKQSLKVTIDKTKIGTDTIDDCTGRAILFLGAWHKEFGVPCEGANAMRVVIYAEQDGMSVIFDISNSGAAAGFWSKKLYTLKKGVNEIIIPVEARGGTFDFSKPIQCFNMDFYNNSEASGTAIYYIDDVEYIRYE